MPENFCKLMSELVTQRVDDPVGTSRAFQVGVGILLEKEDLPKELQENMGCSGVQVHTKTAFK